MTLSSLLFAIIAADPSVALGQQAGDTLFLSLEDALLRASRVAGETRLFEAVVDVTDAQVASARAAGLPTLRVTAGYTQAVENARAQIVGQVFNQRFTYATSANLQQPLFQGGRVVAAARAATAVRRAARLDLEEARSQLAVDVQRAYLGALFAGQLVDIQTRNLALAAERVAQVELLVAGGRAARYDALRARVERSNLEPVLLQSTNTQEIAVLELKRLLNLPFEQPLRLTTQVDPAGVAVIVSGLAAASDSVQRRAVTPAASRAPSTDTRPGMRRASIRAAELDLEARRQGVRVARADYLPTVTAFATIGLLALPSSNRLSFRLGEASAAFCPAGSIPARVCQNNGFFTDQAFGFNVNVPVADFLRVRANVDLAKAQERVAGIQLEQERERVALEGARARAELDRARAAFGARRETVAEAEEAFKLASLRFSRGLSTQLEVSDAQFALLEAESGQARAVYDVHLAAAELARALGRPIPLPPIIRVVPLPPIGTPPSP